MSNAKSKSNSFVNAPITPAAPAIPADQLAAFQAWQAAQAAGVAPAPTVAPTVAQAPAAAPAPAQGGPLKITDTSPEGAGREVYQRDLPVKLTYTWENGRTWDVTLDRRTSEKGKPMAYGTGKTTCTLVSGQPGDLQLTASLTLCKPRSAGKPAAK